MKPAKQRKIFKTEVLNYLSEIGAERVPGLYEEQERYKVETIGGDLLITPDFKPSLIWTVFTKFEDVEKVNSSQFFELNPFSGQLLNRYSGKWNFHYQHMEDLLSVFKSELGKILIKETT